MTGIDYNTVALYYITYKIEHSGHDSYNPKNDKMEEHSECFYHQLFSNNISIAYLLLQCYEMGVNNFFTPIKPIYQYYSKFINYHH